MKSFLADNADVVTAFEITVGRARELAMSGGSRVELNALLQRGQDQLDSLERAIAELPILDRREALDGLHAFRYGFDELQRTAKKDCA